MDFVKLAEALGAEGIRVITKEEFADAFAKAVNMKRPVVLDCQIDRMTRCGRWLRRELRSAKCLMRWI